MGTQAAPTGREIVTVQQVASITGLSVKTLYNLRYLDDGPPLWTLRGRLRCYRDELDAWIAEQAGTANVTPIRRTA
jgi:predicted DNA-binding transcriptional regulator AlpA